MLLIALALLQGPDSPPALPDPAGITSTVSVSTVAQLEAAFGALVSNRKISIAAGTYAVTQTLVVPSGLTNVVVRGATGNRDDVKIVGPGMTDTSIWHGIYASNATGLVIADLTVGAFAYHPLALYDVQQVRVYNVRVHDAGEQLLKSNPTAGATQYDGRVEYSVFEYTTNAPSDYTNGVDVHRGANWQIRRCRFRNIRAPAGQLAGPAILMWNLSSNTLVEGCEFYNCQRGIALGFNDAVSNDHQGGIARNNFFHRKSTESGDVAIYVSNSPNTKILNNTLFLSGTYGTPIEYRWTNTSGVLISNNLLDGTIWARDGATGTVTGNVTTATAAMFANAANGDLHLAAGASPIDAGVALADVTDDWDGGARPSGSAPDIGADEYGSAGGGGGGGSGGSTTTSSDGGGKKKSGCHLSCGGGASWLPAIGLLVLLIATVRRR